mgnify:CR=1 FL=1
MRRRRRPRKGYGGGLQPGQTIDEFGNVVDIKKYKARRDAEDEKARKAAQKPKSTTEALRLAILEAYRRTVNPRSKQGKAALDRYKISRNLATGDVRSDVPRDTADTQTKLQYGREKLVRDRLARRAKRQAKQDSVTASTEINGESLFEARGKHAAKRFRQMIKKNILLVFGLYYFIISQNKKVFDAFLLGLVIYGVYESTNYALLKDWNFSTLVIDTLWGGILGEGDVKTIKLGNSYEGLNKISDNIILESTEMFGIAEYGITPKAKFDVLKKLIQEHPKAIITSCVS